MLELFDGVSERSVGDAMMQIGERGRGVEKGVGESEEETETNIAGEEVLFPLPPEKRLLVHPSLILVIPLPIPPPSPVSLEYTLRHYLLLKNMCTCSGTMKFKHTVMTVHSRFVSLTAD